MKEFLNPAQKHRYTSYSLRIGGTTLASSSGIDHAKIMKYVGWSQKKLPSMAIRYMRFKHEEMALFNYQMIHGYNPKNKIRSNTHFYDPWDTYYKSLK